MDRYPSASHSNMDDYRQMYGRSADMNTDRVGQRYDQSKVAAEILVPPVRGKYGMQQGANPTYSARGRGTHVSEIAGQRRYTMETGFEPGQNMGQSKEGSTYRPEMRDPFRGSIPSSSFKRQDPSVPSFEGHGSFPKGDTSIDRRHHGDGDYVDFQQHLLEQRTRSRNVDVDLRKQGHEAVPLEARRMESLRSSARSEEGEMDATSAVPARQEGLSGRFGSRYLSQGPVGEMRKGFALGVPRSSMRDEHRGIDGMDRKVQKYNQRSDYERSLLEDDVEPSESTIIFDHFSEDAAGCVEFLKTGLSQTTKLEELDDRHPFSMSMSSEPAELEARRAPRGILKNSRQMTEMDQESHEYGRQFVPFSIDKVHQMTSRTQANVDDTTDDMYRLKKSQKVEQRGYSPDEERDDHKSSVESSSRPVKETSPSEGSSSKEKAAVSKIDRMKLVIDVLDGIRQKDPSLSGEELDKCLGILLKHQFGDSVRGERKQDQQMDEQADEESLREKAIASLPSSARDTTNIPHQRKHSLNVESRHEFDLSDKASVVSRSREIDSQAESSYHQRGPLQRPLGASEKVDMFDPGASNVSDHMSEILHHVKKQKYTVPLKENLYDPYEDISDMSDERDYAEDSGSHIDVGKRDLPSAKRRSEEIVYDQQKLHDDESKKNPEKKSRLDVHVDAEVKNEDADESKLKPFAFKAAQETIFSVLLGTRPAASEISALSEPQGGDVRDLHSHSQSPSRDSNRPPLSSRDKLDPGLTKPQDRSHSRSPSLKRNPERRSRTRSLKRFPDKLSRSRSPSPKRYLGRHSRSRSPKRYPDGKSRSSSPAERYYDKPEQRSEKRSVGSGWSPRGVSPSSDVYQGRSRRVRVSCLECGTNFANRDEHDAHIGPHGEHLVCECPHCHRRFSRHTEVWRHRAFFHPSEEREVFKCKFRCGFQTIDKQDWRDHYRDCHGRGSKGHRNVEREVREPGSRPRSAEREVREPGRRPRSAEREVRESSRKSSSSSKDYHCAHCPRTYLYRQSLVDHIVDLHLTRHGSDLQCINGCRFATHSNRTMVDHIESCYRLDKMLEDRRYSQESSHDKMRRYSHSDDDDSGGMNVCKHCGMVLDSKEDLWRHIANKHAEHASLVVTCSSGCGFKTINGQDLIQHMEVCQRFNAYVENVKAASSTVQRSGQTNPGTGPVQHHNPVSYNAPMQPVNQRPPPQAMNQPPPPHTMNQPPPLQAMNHPPPFTAMNQPPHPQVMDRPPPPQAWNQPPPPQAMMGPGPVPMVPHEPYPPPPVGENPSQQPPIPPKPCPVCGWLALNPPALYQHSMDAHGIKLLVCGAFPRCPFMTTLPLLHTEHCQDCIFHQNSSAICELCGIMVANRKEYGVHFAEKHCNFPFTCTQGCTFKTVTKSHLKEHTASCPLFNSKLKLTPQVEMETKYTHFRRPMFPCGKCFYLPATEEELFSHIALAHAAEPSVKVLTCKFKCPFKTCDATHQENHELICGKNPNKKSADKLPSYRQFDLPKKKKVPTATLR